ncbi:MAG: NADH-quinone oxidoreductase subunit NuoG [Rickettsiales bacterium]|nr:NADH-quinone oxidoreductase subunit NuoG [Rickettsiales bacterium]
MPKVSVNGSEIEIESGMTVLQACEKAGEEIPRFCYHERLKIAGNCRMCLVEVQPGPPKPAASCAMPASEGMKIFTNTPMVKKAREGVMEFLLANHPLDCPICDQAGECDLQDQSMAYGKAESRYEEEKRAVKDKYMGPIVKTHMTRCIHCTRCIRFMTDVAGVPELGATGRGEHMEVGTYIEKGLSSELSGNIIDLCPVGALTSKPYAYKARPWELKKTETIDVLDAVGSNIRVDTRGNEVLRVLPRLNEEINEEWISDKTRYAFEGLKYQRLDKPYIRKMGRLQPASWEEAYTLISQILKQTNPERIGAIAGDLVDVESMFALKYMLDNLGVRNYDCRQDGANYNANNRASYLFNTTIEGLEKADLVLLVGSNPRYEAPLVNARIRKVYTNKKIPIAVIGGEVDLSYPHQNLGADPKILEDILAGNHIFCEKLANAKNPVIILGNAIYKRGDAEAILSLAVKISEKYNIIRDDWNGLNALQRAAGRAGGLEIGFVPQNNGKDVYSMIHSAKSGDIEVLILHGADEIDVRGLDKPFVVYIGHHGDAGASVADVILPSAAYTEKNAIYVNLEGRPQKTRLATFPVGEAKQDFIIISELSTKLGLENFSTLDEIRKELENISTTFKNIDNIIPAKWPASSDMPAGRLSKVAIEADFFNFYFTDPISRVSKTMIACNQEFGEEKGFNKKSLLGARF